MKVGILGTGIAGFVAAHAVAQFDPDATIVMYGPNRAPIQTGARFFEREIPGLDTVNRMCRVESIGDFDDYKTKIGNPISKYFKPRPDFLAFNYWEAYQELWKIYNSTVIQLEPDYELIHGNTWDDFDYLFNTAARPNFYPKEDHQMFAATRHWRIDDSDDGPRNPYVVGYAKHGLNKMIFDGSPSSSWFRITQLFGLMSVEWPFNKKPPITGTYLEILPLGVPKELGLRHVTPNWRGTKALAHVGAVAQWLPSTDVGEVYGQVQQVLRDVEYVEEFRNDNDTGRRDSE